MSLQPPAGVGGVTDQPAEMMAPPSDRGAI